MAGFVGERARRKKRNTIIFISLLIIFFLIYLISSNFKQNVNLPSDSFLPSDEEIISPDINTTIDELELKVFDKEQKIIFRDKQIIKLKEDISILVEDNKKFSEKILELDNEINKKYSNNSDVTELNKKINLIKKENKQKIEDLNLFLENLQGEKNNFTKKITRIENENFKLKEDYKILFGKNINLTKIENKLKNRINELKNIIEENELLIKVLEDTSHHNRY